MFSYASQRASPTATRRGTILPRVPTQYPSTVTQRRFICFLGERKDLVTFRENLQRKMRIESAPLLFSSSNVLSLQHGFLTAAALDFGIQFLGWVCAVLLQTEIFYDAIGSLTYIVIAVGSLLVSANRNIVPTLLVSIWAARLGSFLLYRVIKTGHDSRFAEIKKNAISFLVAWMMQGVWILVVSSPLLVVNLDPSSAPGDLGIGGGAETTVQAIGILMWATGFVIECIADYQKLAFKLDTSESRGRFIDRGLWSLSRYPNYFGEMLLWWGFWVYCTPRFHGFQWLTVFSPAFVMLLLLFVSGIPLQEAQAKRRWGEDEAYQMYRDRTRLLVPLPQGIMTCCKKTQ